MEKDIRKKMYIKLYYSLLDWEWYSEPNTFRVFLHLLLTANRKDQPYKGDVIHKGEALASLENISLHTGLSIQNIRTAIANLLSTGEITKRKIGRTNVFTCVNFNNYQDANSVSTAFQQKNNNEITTYQQRNNNEVTTPIYCKNERMRECDNEYHARTYKNKNNINTNVRSNPSYDIEQAIARSLLLDPNNTKRR